MEKNWLIRTKSNHILGPVSKEKILELFNNGSIKSDDEICSGNGFWFFVRETDLVQRFLLGNEIQGFNPISEAKDILTLAPHKIPTERTRDDITLIGSLNIASLKAVPDLSEVVDKAEPTLRPEVIESKKKIKTEVRSISSPKVQAKKPLKKQNYLKYLALIGFLLLFLLIYFRKTIIQSIFHGEISLSSFLLISVTHAQEETPQKKSPLDRIITFDKVEFKSAIGLDGFRVVSSFDLEKLTCGDLKSEIHQLGVILYPPEVFNEKFLIKMRDCVLKLGDTHPLKVWLKWVGKTRPLQKEDQEKVDFLTDIINSQFNLITDLKVKNKIIEHIHEIPHNTLGEKLLLSYLYLMIGNITRSDNILKAHFVTEPRNGWKGFSSRMSIYHRLALNNVGKIFAKLEKHPADRKYFELFKLYLKNFYNDETLIGLVSAENEIEEKISLTYVERIAPPFVHYLRLMRMSDERRIKNLRSVDKYPLMEQSYWEWSFMDISPLVSDIFQAELVRLEHEDQLWFIYLIGNEKLADVYIKNGGKHLLPTRRTFLRSHLMEKDDFMLTLFKLIEIGDIDSQLVSLTMNFLTHE